MVKITVNWLEELRRKLFSEEEKKLTLWSIKIGLKAKRGRFKRINPIE